MIITAPESYIIETTKVFIGGGISGCENWQEKMCQLLDRPKIICFNPRRENFPMSDPTAAMAQIKWEHHYLRMADVVLFWFPPETLCPITLYELGAWSMTTKPVFVGCHPNYQRRQDVVIQSSLVRPEIRVVNSIAGLADQVLEYCNEDHRTKFNDE